MVEPHPNGKLVSAACFVVCCGLARPTLRGLPLPDGDPRSAAAWTHLRLVPFRVSLGTISCGVAHTIQQGILGVAGVNQHARRTVVPKTEKPKLSIFIHFITENSLIPKEVFKMAKAAKKPNNASRTRQSAKRTAAAASLALNVGLGKRTEYRIYPSIGIARVGDSKDGFLIGPEAPGMVPTGPFRGNDKGIKPQAARFRIYKVDIDENENETVLEEVVAGGNTKIEWSVNLANSKAAGSQIIDTLARSKKPRDRNKGLDRKKLVITASGSVTGARTNGPVLAGKIEFAKLNAKGVAFDNIELATLRTDDAGRLLVVGGPGKSDCVPNARADSFADNDGWYDSVSDGPVSAKFLI